MSSSYHRRRRRSRSRDRHYHRSLRSRSPPYRRSGSRRRRYDDRRDRSDRHRRYSRSRRHRSRSRSRSRDRRRRDRSPPPTSTQNAGPVERKAEPVPTTTQPLFDISSIKEIVKGFKEQGVGCGVAGQNSTYLVSNSLTKPARKIYLGNLPRTMALSGEVIQAYLNIVLPALGVKTEYPVMSVWVAADFTYAFVEMRSVRDASRMERILDNHQIGGRPVRVGRAADYKPVPPSYENYVAPVPKEGVAHLVKVREMVEAQRLLHGEASGVVEMGEDCEDREVPGWVTRPTCVMVIGDATSSGELQGMADLMSVHDIVCDVREACETAGGGLVVSRVILPVPAKLIDAHSSKHNAAPPLSTQPPKTLHPASAGGEQFPEMSTLSSSAPASSSASETAVGNDGSNADNKPNEQSSQAASSTSTGSRLDHDCTPVAPDLLGLVFVVFRDAEACNRARAALNGRRYWGHVVQCGFVDPDRFLSTLA